MHAHALEPVNRLLEGLDVKDDYEEAKDNIELKEHNINNRNETQEVVEPNNEEPQITLGREKRQTAINVSHANIDDLLADKSSLDLIPDWDGYYIGDVWSAQRSKNRQRLRSRQRDNVNSYAQRPFYQNVDNQG